MNMTYGNRLKMTITGATHEKEIKVSVSGFPSDTVIDFAELEAYVARRKPTAVLGGTPRREPDKLIIEKGIDKGVTDGGDIVIKVENKDADSTGYPRYDDMPRPSHADYVSHVKYGQAQTGGGIFSGRRTLAYCIAGGLAAQYLKNKGIEIYSFITRIGNASRKGYDFLNPEDLSFLTNGLSPEMLFEIEAARGRSDSVGGIIEGIAEGLPVGIGEPIFDGLDARLSEMLFSMPAVKGVEIGKGFGFAEMCGSSANDSFIFQNERIKTTSNHSGGINGGISNGMPLVVGVAVKPTPSIGVVQNTVSLKERESVALEIKGRHDTCIVPRAAVVVEAVMAFVILDLMLEGGFIARPDNIDGLRKEIDRVDDGLTALAAERKLLAAKIGKLKKRDKLPVEDCLREKAVIGRLAEKSKLEKEDIEKLYGALFEISKKAQE